MSTENAAASARSEVEELDLTPAASEALDINADSFKRQVLIELSRRHRDPDSKVRMSDVQLAVAQIVADGPKNIKIVPRLIRLALTLTVLTLIAQTLIGLHGTTQSWIISGAALLAGISTGTTMVIVVQDVRRRRRESPAASQEFLREILSLEWSARRVVAQALGDGAEKSSLGRIISALEILDIWTPEDSQVFRRLLFLRNSLVHEDSRILSQEDIGFGLSQAARLLSLIRRGQKAVEVSGGKDYLTPYRRRSAISFEERVAHALRQASFDVVSAQRDYGYDLLTETPAGSVAIVTRYRNDGFLEVADIVQSLQRKSPDVTMALVTNAPLSPSAIRYLASPNVANRPPIVISWLEGESNEKLVQSIMHAAAEFPPASV
jgi:hypothetical protein